MASLLEPALLTAAVVGAFAKLHPRAMVRNPVLFVVYVGCFLTTAAWVLALCGEGEGEGSPGFVLAVAVWLWFTVLFANFAEAVAEGRGKARAAALRRTRTTTTA
ncbi:MAG TPA: potassium-transporting ATPase subunit B, partial [Planctomycetota bacterium]|nr:potassium-transporting ATPase subunit B [Planctomycetota bacterium]